MCEKQQVGSSDWIGGECDSGSGGNQVEPCLKEY